MKFPKWLNVYGDIGHRGNCPKESIEQATFFNIVRKDYPQSYGLIATHIKNEGKRNPSQAYSDKAQGLTKGASDIIIPGGPSFVCELKRRDHTKSSWQEGQLEYLKSSQDAGSFVCVALGYKAAIEAFEEWLELVEK